MSDSRPGLNPHRLVRLIENAVRACELDLHGAHVLTEAASGAYVVTPVLAARAGAQVTAVSRTTRYGTVEEITRQTQELARLAGIEPGRIQVRVGKSPDAIAQADIITTSGHVRPIDAATVGLMKPTAVLPLMYESWEYRPSDVDLSACRDRGICIAGTNECHPSVEVFAYLGIMAVKLLLDAGVEVHGSSVLVLCDNPFGPYLAVGLTGARAFVEMADDLRGRTERRAYDAILLAARPGARPVIGPAEAAVLARQYPGAVVAQFWGDIDRAALADARVPYWPLESPGAGHMGILPSGVGPDPIVRLQTGGLKVGEILWRARRQGHSVEDSIAAVEASGFGCPLLRKGDTYDGTSHYRSAPDWYRVARR